MVKVRSATAADIPAILDVERHAPDASHWTREQYERTLAEVPQIEKNRRRSIALVAEDSAIKGFLIGHALDTEWEIENIAVVASGLRRGIGSLLLTEFLETARRERAIEIFLEVRESNLAARGFYEKFAFVACGRRKHYYNDPLEDAVLYRLELGR